jgi:polyisoprenoid-binding protein YceI
MVLTLTLRGVPHSVTFDHEKGALQGLPVLFYADGSIASDDWYVPTLRFLEL